MSNWKDKCEGCENYFPSLTPHTWQDYLDGIGQITASLCPDCIEMVDLQLGLPIEGRHFSLIDCDGCGLEVGTLEWREHPCLDTGAPMAGAYCGECCHMIDTKQDWRKAK